MLEINKFSKEYTIRKMNDEDVKLIYDLSEKNEIYYNYCHQPLLADTIIADLHVLPYGKTVEDKYYVGYFENDKLVAILDLVADYPEEKIGFIGLFMVDVAYQNKGVGSKIINDLEEYLSQCGYKAIRLAINKGNPQSTHFWLKNGLVVLREISQQVGELLYCEKQL